ncbi:hypothetical protein ACNI3T_13760 [Christiangramia sp. ASW11-125]|uniref:hypothetical protein n=1 Tax=Christiangramia sp. ASW11-125 TaxID=3400701 RepID=UPI003AAF0F66
MFPEKIYSIELLTEKKYAITKLKNVTLSDEQFVSHWNDQTFIGEIGENEFQIKLSRKLIGEFCILTGIIDNGRVKIKAGISKTLKLLFILASLFALSGIITAVFQNKLSAIIPIILSVIVIRYIFLEIGFRLVFNRLENKLTRIIKPKNSTF